MVKVKGSNPGVAINIFELKNSILLVGTVIQERACAKVLSILLCTKLALSKKLTKLVFHEVVGVRTCGHEAARL